MDRDELNFVAVGEFRNLKITEKTHSFAQALIACHRIMKNNSAIDSCRVEDRKGNTLKVVKR